jgi:plastocyanin
VRPQVILLAVGIAATALVIPLAQAHCDPGTDGSVAPGVPSTCPFNFVPETAITAADGASGGATAFVLVKDFTFHPNVIHVRSGDTVVFVYADVDWAQQHNPTSTNGCQNGPLDLGNPESCVPPATSPPAGSCFSIATDQGAFLKSPGDTYPLTFRYTSASGLQKSDGVLSGTAPVVGSPPYAQPFKTCPPSSGYAEGASYAIPYHCTIHGGAATSRNTMRGVIVVDP